jgi:hypothetical protein
MTDSEVSSLATAENVKAGCTSRDANPDAGSATGAGCDETCREKSISHDGSFDFDLSI